MPEPYNYPFRVIFPGARKRRPARPLIAGINVFADIRIRLCSKGGEGHRAILLAVRDEGQAMAEYAVVLGLVAAVLVFAFSSLGAATVHLLDGLVSQLGP
jgi:Flp pilus assembly pilin Flp